MAKPRVAVVGASGYIGSAVCRALEAHGAVPLSVRAPRITLNQSSTDLNMLIECAANEIHAQLANTHAVINAAGISAARSGDVESLHCANALLPAALALSCSIRGIRLVHISSAAVQGRVACLDSSDDVAPLTPYAVSKVNGERLVREIDVGAVVYRPPGVHGATRNVSRSLVRLASGRASTVASPGDDNAPQALVQDVADAVVFIALHPDSPPPVVHHPASGMTTASLMRLLSDGQEPRHIPRRFARVVLRLANAMGRIAPSTAVHARRLEILWCGQDQGPSWLTEHGWRPVTIEDDWVILGRETRALRPGRDDDG